jgi:hypothetical protein
LIERVTQQQRKPADFQRERNLNERKIAILNIDDTLADMPERFILAEEAHNRESVFRGMAKIGRSHPGIGRRRIRAKKDGLSAVCARRVLILRSSRAVSPGAFAIK